MQLSVGGTKVHISTESMIWFLVLTAAGTVIGELVYQKWVSPYLADLPDRKSTRLTSSHT